MCDSVLAITIREPGGMTISPYRVFRISPVFEKGKVAVDVSVKNLATQKLSEPYNSRNRGNALDSSLSKVSSALYQMRLSPLGPFPFKTIGIEVTFIVAMEKDLIVKVRKMKYNYPSLVEDEEWTKY